ncbi:hypothetical protein SAMN06295888_1421 [Desulfonatronum zhilinae]|nr:hypothetical protein SAMN06295888_1421 [Desulfonatronum zhilinae]
MDTLADQWMRQGRDGGLIDGRQEGKLKGIRSTILDLLIAKFEHIPMGFTSKLDAIDDIGTLKGLSISLFKAESLEAFLILVDKATAPKQTMQ